MALIYKSIVHWREQYNIWFVTMVWQRNMSTVITIKMILILLISKPIKTISSTYY